MNFNKKLFASINILALSACMVLSADQTNAEQNYSSDCQIEKLDHKLSKILSKKSKALKKLKSNLTTEKQNELAAKVLESNLTDAQKMGVLEVIEQAHTEIEKNSSL